LSGYPPYAADTFSELIVKIATTDPVPLATLRPELPAELLNAVHRALEKDREQRTPSLDILAAELERLAAESPSGPRAVLQSPALRSRVQPAASGVIAQPPGPAVQPTNVTTVPKRGAQSALSGLWLAGAVVIVLAAIAAAYVMSSREQARSSDARAAASAGVTPVLPAPGSAATAVPAPAAPIPEPTVKQTAPIAPSAGTARPDADRTPTSTGARKHVAAAHKPAASRPTADPIKPGAPAKSPRLRAGPLERGEF
jgi:hypothetical protein